MVSCIDYILNFSSVEHVVWCPVVFRLTRRLWPHHVEHNHHGSEFNREILHRTSSNRRILLMSSKLDLPHVIGTHCTPVDIAHFWSMKDGVHLTSAGEDVFITGLLNTLESILY